MPLCRFRPPKPSKPNKTEKVWPNHKRASMATQTRNWQQKHNETTVRTDEWQNRHDRMLLCRFCSPAAGSMGRVLHGSTFTQTWSCPHWASVHVYVKAKPWKTLPTDPAAIEQNRHGSMQPCRFCHSSVQAVVSLCFCCQFLVWVVIQARWQWTLTFSVLFRFEGLGGRNRHSRI